jgi:hypothetical protein
MLAQEWWVLAQAAQAQAARQLNRGKIRRMAERLQDGDPRGLLWIWEMPDRTARYVVGADAAQGIAGWRRETRNDQDVVIDNCAAQVIRVGELGKPDRQVAEFAAPIDAEEFATVLNTLGRMYCGRQASGQAEMIIEVWPGPGGVTQSRLINEYNYSNFFVWKNLRDGAGLQITRKYGWYSDTLSRPQLWVRGNRHITKGNVIIQSPWLVQEMYDCESDRIKMVGKAPDGLHDDRVMALLMGLWMAHDWSNYSLEQEMAKEAGIAEAAAPEWIASDSSYEDMKRAWEDKVQALFDMTDY